MFAAQRPSSKTLRNRADIGRHDLCILLFQPSRRVSLVSLSHYLLLLSPPIFPSHSAHFLSSPLLSLKIPPFAKPVLAFPHSLRNAKTHNPLPRRNLGIRRPRCPKHSLQCSSPVSNDCSSRHLLLRRSHRPNSLLPTWSRYRADE